MSHAQNQELNEKKNKELKAPHANLKVKFDSIRHFDKDKQEDLDYYRNENNKTKQEIEDQKE